MVKGKFEDYRFRQYKPLIGEALVSVETIDDGGAVRFTLADGRTLTYDAVGDCCSTSWIEFLTAPDLSNEPSVFDVTEPDMPPYPASGHLVDDDEIKHYHTAFHTPVGSILVEYRNSSNGYYGGFLEGPREKGV